MIATQSYELLRRRAFIGRCDPFQAEDLTFLSGLLVHLEVDLREHRQQARPLCQWKVAEDTRTSPMSCAYIELSAKFGCTHANLWQLLRAFLELQVRGKKANNFVSEVEMRGAYAQS